MKKHQDYDKIFKESMEKIGTSLLKKLCGIELIDVEPVQTTLARTLERRADFARIGTNAKRVKKQ